MTALRLRSALFRARAILVFIALAVSIVFTMLFGVLASAAIALVQPLRRGKRRAARESEPPRGWSLPTWLQA
jgi:hypothetical protein